MLALCLGEVGVVARCPCMSTKALLALSLTAPRPSRTHLWCRKMLGVWKHSSISWLQELLEGLQVRHGMRGGRFDMRPIVLWD